MKIDLNFVIKKLDGTDFEEFEPDGFDQEGKPKFKKSGKLTISKNENLQPQRENY